MGDRDDDRGGERRERRGPPSIEGMHTLKVDNVPFGIHPEDIRDFFTGFGEIGDIYVPRDHRTGQARGFVFVRFHEKRDAEDAMEALDGKDFRGRDLRIQFANRKRPDNPREFFQQRSRGYDDRRGGRNDRYDDRRGGYDRRGGGSYRDRYDDRRGGGRDRSRSRGRDRPSPSPRRDKSRSRSAPRDDSRSPPPRRADSTEPASP